MDDYRIGYRESGAPGDGQVVLAFHAHVAQTDEDAKANAEEAFNLYLDTRLFYSTRQTYDIVLSKGLGMFGAPRTVADTLVALHGLGIDHVMFLQNLGALPAPVVRDSLRRIAEEVMPDVHQRVGRELRA